MADLLTLAEVKERRGLDSTDTSEDAELTRALASASAAIRAFTERDFGSAEVTETRTYDNDGSGFVDIDDAYSISSVALTQVGFGSHTLDVQEWAALPSRRDDSPVYTYLLIPAVQGFGRVSPEMGFTRNLDVYARERGGMAFDLIEVTAVWGWPTVPEDVKQAAMFVIEEFMPSNDNDRLTSESISGYARSWNRSSAALAIPNRARDLLANYQRINV